MACTRTADIELSTLSSAGSISAVSNPALSTPAEELRAGPAVSSEDQDGGRSDGVEQNSISEPSASASLEAEHAVEASDDTNAEDLSIVRQYGRAALDFLAKEWLANSIALVVVIFTVIMWRLAQWTARNDVLQSCGTLYAIGFSSKYCNDSMAVGVTKPPILKRQERGSLADFNWWSWSQRPVTFTAAIVLTIAAGLYGLIYLLPRREPFHPVVSLARPPLRTIVCSDLPKISRPLTTSIQIKSPEGNSSLDDMRSATTYDAWIDEMVDDETFLEDLDLNHQGRRLGKSYYSSDEESMGEQPVRSMESVSEDDENEQSTLTTLDPKKDRNDGPWLSDKERETIFRSSLGLDHTYFRGEEEPTSRDTHRRHAKKLRARSPGSITHSNPRMSDPNNPTHWSVSSTGRARPPRSRM